jgi:hypothetical protein
MNAAIADDEKSARLLLSHGASWSKQARILKGSHCRDTVVDMCKGTDLLRMSGRAALGFLRCSGPRPDARAAPCANPQAAAAEVDARGRNPRWLPC